MTSAARRPGSRAWFVWSLFLSATTSLFLLSKGKWCDAVVDVGSEWIYADTLARGGVLYRDVVYWFGPFTPYFEAAFFRLLGSSFQTLVVAGVVGSLGALLALWSAVRRVAGSSEAFFWTALAVPALVFMPYSGGSILAMGHRMWHAAAFSLLAVCVATGPLGRGVAGPLLSGALCGLAALCRIEWGVATLAVVIAGGLARRARACLQGAGLALAGAVGMWGGVMGLFLLAAGRRAVLEDGRALLLGLPAETRHFLWKFSGLAQWRTGVASLLYSAGLWLSAFLLIATLSDPSRARRRLPLIAAALVALAAGWAGGASPGAAAFSAAPLACLAALVVAAKRWRAARSRALASFAALGLLLSFRRPLDIRDGGYVAPPLLFAIVAAAGLVHLALSLQRTRRGPGSLRLGVRYGLLVVIAMFFLQRGLHYSSDDRISIRGTGGFLAARAPFAGEIEGLVDAIRRMTPPGKGLVVIPEGALLNYLSGRPNPIRYKLLIPGYLSAANEADVLAELERRPPEAIVLWRGPADVYGKGSFGLDWGERVAGWIRSNYEERPFSGRERKVVAGETSLLIRRGVVNSGAGVR